MKKFKKILQAYIILSFVLPVSSGVASIQKEIESELMCMCKDNCGKVLESCICQYADGYRTDISMKLKEGLTKEEVIQTYIDKYGETALSAPTKSGFNLTAWITPFAALMIGGFGIRRVISSWVSARENEKEEVIPDKGDIQPDSKYSSLLKKELKEFD